MTISHADTGYRTRVAAVRGEYVNTASAGQQNGISYPKKVGHAEKKIEIKDAKRRILTLFEALFWELVLPVVTGPSVNSCFLTCCIDM